MPFNHRSAGCTIALVSGAAAFAVVPAAHAHEGDIGITTVAGQLVTGNVEDPGTGQVVIPGARVFGGEANLGPGVGDEPGFFATAGTLTDGSLLGFNIRAALRKWNPLTASGNDIAAETMTLEDPSGTQSATTPALDALVAGWSFVFPGTGDFDDHPNVYVNGRTGDGVYILQLELTTSEPGVATSAPLWVVLNDGLDDQQHDAAITWTENYLAPAPGGAALTVIGALAMARRRR